MKTYKSMYDQIYLNPERKQAILQNLREQEMMQGQIMPNSLTRLQEQTISENQTMLQRQKRNLKKPKFLLFSNDKDPTGRNRKRMGMSAYAALLLCLILLPGATIFAMGNTALAERISTAFESFFRTQQDLSEGQMGLYAQYSSELEVSLQTENGTLYLDSILYDGHYLLLPFTMDSSMDSRLPYTPSLANDFDFYLGDSPLPLGRYTNRDPQPLENGRWQGSYLLTAGEEGFQEGDVIHIRERNKNQSDSLGKAIGEIMLPAVPDSQNLSFSTEQLAAAIGTQVDRITLSPLSMGIRGSGDADARKLFYGSYLELKDGTVVQSGGTGNGGSCRELEDGSTDFFFYLLWEKPVELEQVKMIHLITNAWKEDGSAERENEILLPVEME